MKILVVGSGAREHAIGYAIKKNSSVKELYFAPGNGGTTSLGENIPILANDIENLLIFARENNIDLTVVGPEEPLCKGIVDIFEKNGLKIFGPSKAAARLEGSKNFAKEFMLKHGIPTGSFYKVDNIADGIEIAETLLKQSTHGKVVLKADGLCQGKGVVIAENSKQVNKFLKEVFETKIFGETTLLIEEYLEGFEVSFLCFTDNNTILPMPTVKDHKKIFEGEEGPNTGGMGTYSPNVQADVYFDEIMNNVARPFLKGIREDKLDFRGVIFFGIMVTPLGIKVLEFNTRFGDPETQSIVLRLETDIVDVFKKTIAEQLSTLKLEFNSKKIISTVIASKGYPQSYNKGVEITGLVKDNVNFFHSGTKKIENILVSDGGRVLTVCSAQNSFEEAYKAVYDAIENVTMDGKTYRSDISPLVNRIYVKKKEEFDIEGKSLKKELIEKLKINVKSINIYQRYDLQNISKDEIMQISDSILSEPPVDQIFMFEDMLMLQKEMREPLVIQYHQGQFDQRNQGLIEAISVTLGKENVIGRCATVIDLGEDITIESRKKIEDYLVNPVDQEIGNFLEIPTTLQKNFVIDIKENSYDDFTALNEDELKTFLDSHKLAMSISDLKEVQSYFIGESRNPTETEIAVIDTYWSDHCRHTTFNTSLVDIDFPSLPNNLDLTIKETFEDYMACRRELGKTGDVTLMDLGTIVQKHLKANGKLKDLEISDENNACSIKVKVKIDERIEEYLLMFKNETHNHPTEIEPFGGASTCLGGAIRDPLSGRSYVYQAMRVTGSADPREPLENTLNGKLPQRQICLQSARGYSSYGNQIGLATGLVEEVYHPNFKAKRMEVGAVIGATPIKNVKRDQPAKGDAILLIGGRTGRDGIGGATGSSKEHTEKSINNSSSEVQKGNAPMERKLQRLFRNPEVSLMIKKCNDFGAGGVSVAIGELADSVEIKLDKMPLKYQGLTPKEISLSESQERMAVVIEEKNKSSFFELCYKENLEVTHVADVTDTNRLVIKYGNLKVVDISRPFINSAGARRTQSVKLNKAGEVHFLEGAVESKAIEDVLFEKMRTLNIGSQKGLIENFDASIGRGTVLSPLGGKNQLTPIQSMVALIPSLEGKSYTTSLMSYGYNPYLSMESPFLGAYYAVIESLGKLAASGADIFKARLSFQEYFEKLGNSKEKWGKPLEASLGAYNITKELSIPPIGGKDSMSGTFKELDVPPTLISFAVATEDVENIISPELKGCRKIGLITTPKKPDKTLDVAAFKANIKLLHTEILNKNVVSAYAINHKGVLPMLMEMSFGNDYGFDIKLGDDTLFIPQYGSFIVEYKEEVQGIVNIGNSKENKAISVNGQMLPYDSLKQAYLGLLSDVYVQETTSKIALPKVNMIAKKFKSKTVVENPKVLVTVFPGTNCEYDSKFAFEAAGAEVDIFIFNNLSVEDIKLSIENLAKKIKETHILFIPGGFSLSDEPNGSGKYIASVLMNPKIKNAIEYLLNETDGLIIGICNGFQALIKTGLLPYGKIQKATEKSPTLTYNLIGRHISRMVDTKLVSNNSPWLSKLNGETIYKVPISHGEGRFICDEETYRTLVDNKQIAFMYLDNPNGSDYSIEGIVSPCGKILGKMAHTERIDKNLYKNIPNMVEQNIFEAGVEFFKK